MKDRYEKSRECCLKFIIMKNLSFVLVITILATLASCRGTRDSKALGRVLANANLREQVYQVQSGLHPIAPQQPIYIKGKDTTIRDTTIVQSPYPVYIDSTVKCPPSKVITITKYSVDTLKVKDTSLLRLFYNAVQSSNFKDGQIIEKAERISEYKKQITKRTWIDIIAGTFALAIIGFLIYLLSKKR